jgi:hypothetical protein
MRIKIAHRKRACAAASLGGIIIVLLLLQNSNIAQAQNYTSFTPTDKFSIPSQNGEIRFSTNGTYANATLIGDTWSFTDLRLNGSTPIDRLTVSAKDSDVLITSYRGPTSVFNTTFRAARLRYMVERSGQQTFNIGIPAGDGRWGLHPEWAVIVDNVWLGEGDGWSITPEGNLTVTGKTGNISIVHYGILGNASDSNLSFYEKHSVAIITVASVGAIAIVATLVTVKNKANKPTENLGSSSDIDNSNQLREGD